jgi:chromosome segregation ATPase
MADVVSGGGGARLPQSFGEKLAFSFPAILVTFVLSVAVAVVVLVIVVNSAKTELTEQMDAKNKALKEAFETAQSALKKDLEGKVAVVQQKAEELDNNLQKTKLDVAEAKLRIDKHETSLAAHEASIAKATETTTKHETVLAKHEEKLHYIDEKLAKLDEIKKDVDSLKSDTAGLQKEYQVLSGDLNAVRTKADVTEKDLADLGERARQFQVRVLLARAREASEAARNSDVKSLLQRLADVEGGK